MDSPACPLCDSAKTEKRSWIEIPTLGEKTVRGCSDCGFHFVHPRPSGEELRQFYSAEYFADDSESGHGYDDYSRKEHARWAEGYVFGRKLARWKSSGRLLELGAGRGEFLCAAVDASGWKATGVELSEDAVASARAACAGRAIEFHPGELAEQDLVPGSFDAVIARDVIEHLIDPAQVLRQLKALLVPGGRLWMNVPNAHTELAPFRRANAADRAGFEGQAHLNYFFPDRFAVWLEKQGWVVDRAYTIGLKRGLFALGYLPGALKTSRWRRRGGGTGNPSDRPNAAPQWKRSRWYGRVRHRLKYSFKLPISAPWGQELYLELINGK